MTMNGKAVALVIVSLLAVGILMVIVARPEEEPAGKPAAAQAERNPERELALAFYKAGLLVQNPEAAWGMMHPLNQQGWGGTLERYLAAKRMSHRMETPADLQIQEWRRPQQGATTFLFRSALMDPFVIVVFKGEDGKLQVIDEHFWKGEELP